MSRKNPFVEKCLKSHPFVSADTARLMEIAWDKALESALAVINGKATREVVSKLMSTRQRDFTDNPFPVEQHEQTTT